MLSSKTPSLLAHPIPPLSSLQTQNAPNSFGIRTSEKHLHNPFRMNTSKTKDLKSFRIRTYEKKGEGDPPSVEIPFMEYLDANSLPGVPMPRYLSQHTLACLTRQGAETLAQRMQGGGPACAERVLVNMVEGKMFAEFRSDSRETLEAWLKAEGMHYDWVVRLEWEMRDGKLHIAE
jgi:hypothetical protein